MEHQHPVDLNAASATAPPHRDEQSGEIRIHIDQRPYHTPSPTSGPDLYALVDVPPNLMLFNERIGDQEDNPIPRDALAVHLKQDQHFHSGAAAVEKYHVFVNTQPRIVNKAVLTYIEAVRLAYPNAVPSPTMIYTVTYKKAVAPMHQGSLVEGGKVQIKNGTILNVTETDKS